MEGADWPGIGHLILIASAHPIVSFSLAAFVVVVAAIRKEGVIIRWLSYLEKRAQSEAIKENRRIEMLEKLYERGQLKLPGFEDSKKGDNQ